MNSTCCDCDRTASRYWGELPFCARCLAVAQAENPTAHQCPECHREQPPHVSWRGKPCGECQQENRGPAVVAADPHNQRSDR
jgi:hypothetical protein